MKKIVLVLSVFICMIMGLISCKKERIDTPQSSIKSESAAKIIEKDRIDGEYGYLEGRWYKGGAEYDGECTPIDGLTINTQDSFLDIKFNQTRDMLVIDTYAGAENFLLYQNNYFRYNSPYSTSNPKYSDDEIDKRIKSDIMLKIYSKDIIVFGRREIGIHKAKFVNQVYFKKPDFVPASLDEIRSLEGEAYFDKEHYEQLRKDLETMDIVLPPIP